MSWPITAGTIENTPDRLVAARAPAPVFVPPYRARPPAWAAALRARWRAAREMTLMWMHTGTPASSAAAQKASSSSSSCSPPEGQLEITTVLKPRSTARCSIVDGVVDAGARASGRLR